MTQKINFVNRNKDVNTKSRVINAQKIIDYFLSLHPDNHVIVDSPLYNLAVKQYNDTVKTTKIRPPVPNWFCGKVDAATGELSLNPTDEDLRLSSGFVLDPTQKTIVVPSKDILTYDSDICLQFGAPGSYGYSRCKDNLTEEEIETSGIDWASSIASWTVEPTTSSSSESSGSGGSGGGSEESGDSETTAAASLKLTVTGISHSRVSFSWSPAKFGWSSTIVECFRANGKGGKFDWIRSGGQSVKLLENIYGGYGVWKSAGVPKAGEKVTFRWRTPDGSKSSNKAKATWV
jgi:hypothetical protein